MGMKFEKTDEGRYRLNVNGYVCPHPQIYTKMRWKSWHRVTSWSCFSTIRHPANPSRR